MNQAFALKVGFKMCTTNIGAQKIDNITLETYKMIVFIFFLFNKDRNIRFFKDIFLLTNISLEIFHKMFFFTMNNADIDF